MINGKVFGYRWGWKWESTKEDDTCPMGLSLLWNLHLWDNTISLSSKARCKHPAIGCCWIMCHREKHLRACRGFVVEAVDVTDRSVQGRGPGMPSWVHLFDDGSRLHSTRWGHNDSHRTSHRNPPYVQIGARQTSRHAGGFGCAGKTKETEAKKTTKTCARSGMFLSGFLFGRYLAMARGRAKGWTLNGI